MPEPTEPHGCAANTITPSYRRRLMRWLGAVVLGALAGVVIMLLQPTVMAPLEPHHKWTPADDYTVPVATTGWVLVGLYLYVSRSRWYHVGTLKRICGPQSLISVVVGLLVAEACSEYRGTSFRVLVDSLPRVSVRPTPEAIAISIQLAMLSLIAVLAYAVTVKSKRSHTDDDSTDATKSGLESAEDANAPALK